MKTESINFQAKVYSLVCSSVACFMKGPHVTLQELQSSDSQARSAFNEFDKNGDKHLNLDEFTELIKFCTSLDHASARQKAIFIGTYLCATFKCLFK